MIHYYTALEVSIIYDRPVGTIWRLACVDQWRRSTDERRPVLYQADDVEATMRRLAQKRSLTA